MAEDSKSMEIENNLEETEEQNIASRLSNKLNKLAQRLKEEGKASSGKHFSFEGVGAAGLNPDTFSYYMEKQEAIEEAGYIVEIEENIDIKDLTTDKKYRIVITDKDGCFVAIDYAKYRELITDYTSSEEEFIEEQLRKLSGIGIENIKEISSDICEYLSYLMYFRDLYVKTYKNIGWDTYNNKMIFKYDVIYWPTVEHDVDSDIENKDDKEIIEFIKRNNLEGRCLSDDKDKLHSDIPYYMKRRELTYCKWIIDMYGFIINKPKVNIIIGAACTGLIRPLVSKTKETNINLNIVGDPASGKSSICHLALSLFGNPDKLEGSFSDSDNANELERVKRPIIPYIIDERMLKYATDSDKTQAKKFFMSIFKEYEGKASLRLSGGGREFMGQRTMSPVISSSTKPLLKFLEDAHIGDAGQYRRFIELKIEKEDLFDSSEEAKEAEQIAYETYGYGCELMVRYLQRDEIVFKDMLIAGKDLPKLLFDSYMNWVKAELNKKDTKNIGLDASAQRFALILTSLKIFKLALADRLRRRITEYLGIEKDTNANDPDANDTNVNDTNIKYTDAKYEAIIKRLEDDKNNEEALKILVDNLSNKMEKVKYKADALENLKLFIEEDVKRGTDAWVASNGSNFRRYKHIGFWKKGEAYGKEKQNRYLIIVDKAFVWLIFEYKKIPKNLGLKLFISEIKKKDINKDEVIRKYLKLNITGDPKDVIPDEDKQYVGYTYSPVTSYLGGASAAIIWHTGQQISDEEIKFVAQMNKRKQKVEQGAQGK